ncbi:GspH/FimT family pseudopilin [Maricaulaceae bacterium EIL42A08]|nr:GspH/FimT family pseudopilin [Maricaulaceae bacterium EIL42A08]
MDQTATSSASKPADAGLTLLEMLAALAITAIVTSFVALSLAGSRDARTLDQAASRLAGDLRAARTEALRSGRALALVASPAGYTIEGLTIERRWPSSVDANWMTAGTTLSPREPFVFSPERLTQAGLRVEIQREGVVRQIRVDAITGRIHGVD